MKGYTMFFVPGCFLDNITVQEPHPPWPHPSLVPGNSTAGPVKEHDDVIKI